MEPEPVVQRRHERDLVDYPGRLVVAAEVLALGEWIRDGVAQAIECAASLPASEIIGVEAIGAGEILLRVDLARGIAAREGVERPRRFLRREGHGDQIVEIDEGKQHFVELSREFRLSERLDHPPYGAEGIAARREV